MSSQYDRDQTEALHKLVESSKKESKKSTTVLVVGVLTLIAAVATLLVTINQNQDKTVVGCTIGDIEKELWAYQK